MYYYLYHPCMCTTSTSVHVCHAMAHTNKRAIAERKFCMMRIQSHFDMHSIFICENFVYTQIDYIYLYVDIFVRIFSDRFHLLLLSVSVSLSPSHSLPFRVRARPSVFRFQFSIYSKLCVCIVHESQIFDHYCHDFFVFLSSVRVYCHRVMWVHLRLCMACHGMITILSVPPSSKLVPILSIFICQCVQFLLALFPSIYTLSARPHLNDLLWKNKTKKKLSQL